MGWNSTTEEEGTGAWRVAGFRAETIRPVTFIGKFPDRAGIHLSGGMATGAVCVESPRTEFVEQYFSSKAATGIPRAQHWHRYRALTHIYNLGSVDDPGLGTFTCSGPKRAFR